MVRACRSASLSILQPAAAAVKRQHHHHQQQQHATTHKVWLGWLGATALIAATLERFHRVRCRTLIHAASCVYINGLLPSAAAAAATAAATAAACLLPLPLLAAAPAAASAAECSGCRLCRPQHDSSGSRAVPFSCVCVCVCVLCHQPHGITSHSVIITSSSPATHTL